MSNLVFGILVVKLEFFLNEILLKINLLFIDKQIYLLENVIVVEFCYLKIYKLVFQIVQIMFILVLCMEL